MKEILCNLGLILCGLGLFHIIGGFVYLMTGGVFWKWMYHDIMGWHLPSERKKFNGCSFVSKCKFCGKEILQDGQGNWF